MKLNFQKIFNNPLFKLCHFQKNFLDGSNFLTIFPAIHQSQSMRSGLAIELQIRSFLVRTLLMYMAGHWELTSFGGFEALIDHHQVMINIK